VIEGSAEAEVHLDRLLVGLSEQQVRVFLNGVGHVGDRVIESGFVADLGSDRRPSNWPRRSNGHRSAEVKPEVKGQTLKLAPERFDRGMIAMFEFGRTPRSKGDKVITQVLAPGSRGEGPRVRRRTTKRTVGPMAAKGTWSDGARVLDRALPRIVKEWNSAVRRGAFGR